MAGQYYPPPLKSLKAGVKRLSPLLELGANTVNLFLNKFTWWYHLQINLNISISTDNFINDLSVLDTNPAGFLADLYYNIIAGSKIKPLVFGANIIPLLRYKKIPGQYVPDSVQFPFIVLTDSINLIPKR